MYESKVYITHSDCVGIEKKTYSICFIIYESKLVLFISSYWLVHALVRCRVHWCSHPALCLLQRGAGGRGCRGGARFSDMFCKWFHSEDVSCVQKREDKKCYISAHSLISCDFVDSISLFVANFFQCWSCSVTLLTGLVSAGSERKLPEGGIQHFPLKLALQMLRGSDAWSRVLG